MKIAITAVGPELDSQVEPRFGRCPYFVIIDTETTAFEALENPNVALGGGAGIQSAQLLSNHQVQAVLTGNCGPNAFATLGAAEIQVVVGVSGTVRQAAEQFKSGAFSGASGPNVASHFGMTGQDPTNAPATSPTWMNDGVTGTGQGMGGGMGGGRGMGRGMGQGGGRGMGMGGGRGRGRGMGMGSGAMVTPLGSVQADGPIPQPTIDPVGSDQELEMLKAQAQEMNDQLQTIHTRINQIEQTETASALVATVNADKCTGCGVCERVCPRGAIKVNGQAVINPELCTACGICVSECPNSAIVITQQKT